MKRIAPHVPLAVWSACAFKRVQPVLALLNEIKTKWLRPSHTLFQPINTVLQEGCKLIDHRAQV